jgi:YD repeat-containing protein
VILAVIATLSQIYYARSSNDVVLCQQEYRAVQAGLIAYMVSTNSTTVTPATTNNMSVPVPLHNPRGEPTFVRDSSTVYTYTWDSFGRITSISESASGPPIPAGCVVAG